MNTLFDSFHNELEKIASMRVAATTFPQILEKTPGIGGTFKRTTSYLKGLVNPAKEGLAAHEVSSIATRAKRSPRARTSLGAAANLDAINNLAAPYGYRVPRIGDGSFDPRAASAISAMMGPKGRSISSQRAVSSELKKRGLL